MLALQGAIERGFVGKLVSCLVNGRIRETPEPPGLLHPEGFRRIRQMFPLVPLVECLAFFGVCDRRTNDEEGSWHGFLRIVFLIGRYWNLSSPSNRRDCGNSSYFLQDRRNKSKKWGLVILHGSRQTRGDD